LLWSEPFGAQILCRLATSPYGARGGPDDKVARTIVERNANLRVIREILIRLGDVKLKVFEK
jgi:hypothetical protein